MDVNSRQIGGTHYKSKYEHWDLVLNLNLGYLDGVATKYITRWRKAARPVQDLQKAEHYVDKMIDTWRICYPRQRVSLRACHSELNKFIEANNLAVADAAIIINLVTWDTLMDLTIAKNRIGALLMDQVRRPIQEARPVPAEDSNRHADRMTEQERQRWNHHEFMGGDATGPDDTP